MSLAPSTWHPDMLREKEKEKEEGRRNTDSLDLESVSEVGWRPSCGAEPSTCGIWHNPRQMSLLIRIGSCVHLPLAVRETGKMKLLMNSREWLRHYDSTLQAWTLCCLVCWQGRNLLKAGNGFYHIPLESYLNIILWRHIINIKLKKTGIEVWISRIFKARRSTGMWCIPET